jgi:hypothetical protein
MFADVADKTHTILTAGGSGLVGHAAIKFAIAAGHFVIALVRRGGSLSVEGLASLIGITWRHSGRSVERRGPVTSDWCRPSAPMLDPAISISAPKAKRKRPFGPAAICVSTTRVRVFFWVSGLKLTPVSASASSQRRWLRHY